MKSSNGLPETISDFGTLLLPVMSSCNPKNFFSSSSDTASGLSILFPKIRTGHSDNCSSLRTLWKIT